MEEGYLAEIRGFAGNFAPKNWAYCAGQVLTITSNQALFSLIGAIYGGNGQTTFALPDLRGRVPVSHGQSTTGYNYQLGQAGGAESVTLAKTQMPLHTHLAATAGGNATVYGGITALMKVNDDESEGKNPSGQFLSVSSSPDIYAGSDTGVTLNSGAISVDISQLSVEVSGISVQINNAGGSTPVSLMQPYAVINWIICTSGLYPQRS